MCYAQGATGSTHGSSLLHALQPHKVQPACMKLEAIAQDAGDLLVDESTADATPVLQVRCVDSYILSPAQLGAAWGLCYTMSPASACLESASTCSQSRCSITELLG
jgi:hypothetical protein